MFRHNRDKNEGEIERSRPKQLEKQRKTTNTIKIS